MSGGIGGGGGGWVTEKRYWGTVYDQVPFR